MRVKESTINTPIPRKKNNKNPSSKMVIPLVKAVTIKDEEQEYLTFKLRSDPSNDQSITYSVKLTPFNVGSPEEWLKHLKTLRVIFKGQNLTRAADKFAMTKRLLKGQALSVFEKEISTEGLSENNTNLEQALEAVTADVFPTNTLAQQKWAMRRLIRKPLNMKVTHLLARLTELNDQLVQYPGATEDSKMSEDELKEIIEFAIPNRWNKQMTLQRFHVYNKNLTEVVEFCKDMEDYEAQNPSKKPSPKSETKTSSTAKGKRKRRSDDVPVCMIHGPGHSTDDCKVLQAKCKTERAMYLKKLKSTKAGLKTNSSETYSKQEVHAMLKKCKQVSVSEYRKKRKLDKKVETQRTKFENFNLESDEPGAESESETSIVSVNSGTSQESENS